MTRILILFSFLLISHIGKAQLYSDSISVNFFLIDECRISQNMSAEINHVHETFASDAIQFECYFPNSSSTVEKIEGFLSDYQIDIPYTTDYDKKKTMHYGASIAPEVVVYDEKKKEVLYKGRIDNSFDAVGTRRRVITSRDLRETLQAIIEQKEITTKETQAIGCFLNIQKQ